MSISIRAVGHASRRGAIRRVPRPAALLEEVEAWLTTAAAETVRGHRPGLRTDDGALEVRLHPAARPVRFEASEQGVLTATATTIPVGPGYHTYIARLLHRLADAIGVTWAPAADPDGGAGEVADRSADPTGAFFSEVRTDAERGHLDWLRASLHAVHEARRQGQHGLHLATPAGVRYSFDGAVATVLGPRDDDWVARALADPRVAADIWPWIGDAMDARYELGVAMTLLWNEVRWRPPVNQAEVEVLDEVLARLRRGQIEDPSLPWPWAAWREVFDLRGHVDPSVERLLDQGVRAATWSRNRSDLRSPDARSDGSSVRARSDDDVADDRAIGYRRGPVTILYNGWALDLPGSFSETRTADRWIGSDARRTVTLSAAPTTIDGSPMSTQAFLQHYTGGFETDVLTHAVGELRGRARATTDPSRGVVVGRIEGFSAITGSGAVIVIDIDDLDDEAWAVRTWRTLRPLPGTGGGGSDLLPAGERRLWDRREPHDRRRGGERRQGERRAAWRGDADRRAAAPPATPSTAADANAG
ncbi:MAG TPA: hypothetical protein VH440_11940 [Candidatus Limnocylindrales bacterium]